MRGFRPFKIDRIHLVRRRDGWWLTAPKDIWGHIDGGPYPTKRAARRARRQQRAINDVRAKGLVPR